MGKINFDTPIRYLNGVGEKRAETFAKMGIFKIRDLLYHFPRAYQHRGNIKLLTEAQESETCAFMLTIASEPRNAMLKGRMTLTKFLAFDESEKCEITFFNQGYLSKTFTVGAEFRFWGKVQRKAGKFSIVSPSFEPYYTGIALPEFCPVYPLSGNLTQKYISKIIQGALSMLDEEAYCDIIPDKIRKELHLPTLGWALGVIHNPVSYEMLEKARRRFVFEELYTFALAMKQSNISVKREGAPVINKIELSQFFSVFGFEPTNAQKRVISEIENDMSSGFSMNRLVAGDVGSGKTLCAAAAVFLSAKSGYQSMIMAPTEILASQHANDLNRVFTSLGISCALLAGSTPAAQKREIKKALANGELDVIIGTHALLSDDVKLLRPGLIVTDEQHRFGVTQRAALAAKGNGCHILVMSATPIPRTLALIMYGDLSLSYVDELPPGRQKISTFVVDDSYRKRMNGFIEKQVGEGRQVYIVCPAIEAKEDEGEGLVGMDYHPGNATQSVLKNATDYAKELRELFPDINISLMHGKMKGKEKDAIMSAFAAGDIDVLVSTTVIEVGVNVPNASLMIVENAERFGLSALHQLRGRVGRGAYKSWCILVSDSKSDEAKLRLEAMTNTNDGFEIAKKDLEIRGPGDYLPDKSGNARQHGGFQFKLASLCDNTKDLENAFRYADSVLALDPNLESFENKAAGEAVRSLFSDASNSIN